MNPGMCRKKALARSFVWWPGRDMDIEDIFRPCPDCAETQGSPKTVLLLEELEPKTDQDATEQKE